MFKKLGIKALALAAVMAVAAPAVTFADEEALCDSPTASGDAVLS